MAETPRDRFFPGSLNPAVESFGADEIAMPMDIGDENFFSHFHDIQLRSHAQSSFKGVTKYKAIVLTEPDETRVGGVEIPILGVGLGGQMKYGFRFRIPEIHSGIPDPCAAPPDNSGTDSSTKKYIGLHPWAISAFDAAGDSASSAPPKPSVGDIVWIQYAKGPPYRLSEPTYIGIFQHGNTNSTSTDSDSRTNNLSNMCNGLDALLQATSGGTLAGNDYAPSGGYDGDPSTWPTSATATELSGSEAEDIHTTAKAYWEKLGYTWHETPYAINLIGIRNSNTTSTNAFDDKKICIYTDDNGIKHIKAWPSTTRPGKAALNDVGTHRSSIAIMVPSDPQYAQSPEVASPSSGQKTYYLGHKGGDPSNPRGRNAASGIGPDPVQAYRDSDGDDVFSYDPSIIGGCTQCQLHGTSPSSSGRTVSGVKADGSAWAWSEGCQVWANWSDYTTFLSLWQLQIQNGRDNIDYVLARREDVGDLWSAVAQSNDTTPTPAVS